MNVVQMVVLVDSLANDFSLAEERRVMGQDMDLGRREKVLESEAARIDRGSYVPPALPRAG